MIKYPFTPADALNEHYYKILGEVAHIFRQVTEAVSKHFRCLILEEFGSVLEQGAWRDYTGYYLTFRLAPLDKHRPEVKEAADRVVKRFSEMLKCVREPEVVIEGDTYTVTIISNSNTIGD